MKKNFYLSGDHNVTCDVCSKKIKFSIARKRWDGLLVCPDDFEMRHPQDFVKTRQDKISVPETRPIPTLVFREDVCSIPSSTGYAGIAAANCAGAGRTFGMSYADILYSYTNIYGH